MIYKPDEDTFVLAKYVKKYAKGKVLDLGCGCGYLTKIALENTKDVLAADIDEEAVDLCRRKGINAIKSDLFENIKAKFDLIVFNPPYLPKAKSDDDEYLVITKESNNKNYDAIIGGENGYEVIERFLYDAKNYLKENGIILIVFSTLTGNVESLIKKYNYKFEILEEMPLFFERLKVLKLKLI